jgi:serine/threonine-protein kinase
MSTPSFDDWPTPLAPGDSVGSYVLEGVIADGGMGIVYRAHHRILTRRAAVKVMHANLVGRLSSCERMLQEARVLESIAGPAAVQIYDAGVLDDGRPWVAMELVEGETLADYLHRRGALPPGEVVELMLGLVHSLAAAHARGVVHRDLKPENVMILLGEPRSIKLIDWGIARVPRGDNRKRITQLDSVPGTPNYMAPEQIRGWEIDGRADIYALGVLAFELLSGKPPFRGTSAIDVCVQHLSSEPPPLAPRCPGMPSGLEELVLDMLEKNRDHRPALDEIRQMLHEQRALLRSNDRASDDLEVEWEMEIEIDLEREELEDAEIARKFEAAVDVATQPLAPPPRSRGMRWTPPVPEEAAPNIAAALERAVDHA